MTAIDAKALVQKVHLKDDTLKIHCPCAISISGSSRSGKSSLIVKLIKNRSLIFDASFDRIIYCQAETLNHHNNKTYEDLKESFNHIEICTGLPDITQLQLNADPLSYKCLILDDLMSTLLKSEQMVDVFTVMVSHSRLVLIYSIHNSFYQTKYAKTMQRNTDVRFLFFNRLEQTELRILSCQLGKKSNFLFDCFKFLLNKFPHELYPYLLINGQPQSHDFYIRSHIFPNENGEIKPIIFFEI